MTTLTAPRTRTGLLVQLLVSGNWFTVCPDDLLAPGRGVAALLPDGRQAAVFRDRGGRLHAVDNRDPFSGAAVLSRGLIGHADGRPFVASPLLKQRFDLVSGQCLDDATVTLTRYDTRVHRRKQRITGSESPPVPG
ncbi:nitrite reductase (NAD(P)H) small subunit [Streptomyces triticagri]|uniref:Nitrite reductase (NAD(P)H) small subunit n=1 Tax=Streptomyces triticagri TaxID=2293568 RepID=A0A372M3T3_9ACTN|nr:nitrite reductase small subunit NirD [Streptomyces triticagri]RFU85123.1 nitrite reductase (NAD(P)H) small subunit [Streptomyces triticagri]